MSKYEVNLELHIEVEIKMVRPLTQNASNYTAHTERSEDTKQDGGSSS